jgi:hypothetical protein
VLGVALDQFLAFARGRSAWISVQRQRLRGLVGARPRGGKQAWEVDYLVDATEAVEALPGLLDCAIADLGRAGAEKVFLRLGADSALIEPVTEAGFIPFRDEVLYARVGLPARESDVPLRPLNPGDSYLAFRLYAAATPGAARRCEAATFSEWHASQERRWLRDGVQLARENNGDIDAVVRAARLAQGVMVELLVTDAARESAPALIRGAVKAVEGGRLPIFVLVPSLSGLEAPLEAAGFDCQAEYVSLLRRTTRPLALPKLTPAIAKTAIGV